MLNNKIALVTGASSGIGAACATQLAIAGVDLILAARRKEALDTLASELAAAHGIRTHVLVLDVSDATAVQATIEGLPSDWQAINILINNAGLALGLDRLYEGNPADWGRMIDVNIKGLLNVTRYVLPGMRERNVGHIVNLGSISSEQVYAGGSVYCATKHAVRAISEGMKMDVHGTQIRVFEIDPGMVDTDFSTVRFSGDKAKAEAVYAGIKALTAEDIANVVMFVLSAPAHVNIQKMMVLPTDQTASHMVNRSHVAENSENR